MKKLFILTFIFLCLSFSQTETPYYKGASVYICNSSGATKYHLVNDCRGLNACNHGVISVSVQEAYKRGKKTLCGWED